MSNVRIGIDLGGTKIEGVAIDASGTPLWRERVATPKNDYAGTINAIGELVERAELVLGVRASIGMGTPGSVSPATGLHRNANSTVLNRQPFVSDVSARLAREVRSSNDANCFALSEAVTGAARGARVVFGVILGTGVGGGVVIDGRALDGHNGIAGEWGHSPMPGSYRDGRDARAGRAESPARPCFCGLVGCREQFLSGPAVERDHAERTGQRLVLADIARKSAAGDSACAATIERLIDGLALSLADVVNLLDPDAIVLGGGVSNIEALYAVLPGRVAQRAFTDSFTTPICRAAHGDSSGVFGAAMLWPSTSGAQSGPQLDPHPEE
ncbi:MAG: ROK family protein [Phycisphaerae bacterium]|nr:ROK family protein [Phycisphaerae bacterium]